MFWHFDSLQPKSLPYQESTLGKLFIGGAGVSVASMRDKTRLELQWRERLEERATVDPAQTRQIWPAFATIAH
jgi:hypothetical protein